MSVRVDKTAVVSMAVVVLLLFFTSSSIGTTTTETDHHNKKYDEAKSKAKHAGNEAINAGKEASKESSESWTGWVKDKVSDSLGLPTITTDQAKDAGHRASDATIDGAKSTKDKISVGVGEYSAEKADEMKNKASDVAGSGSAYDKAQNVKEGVGSMKDGAYDKAQNVKDGMKESAYDKAQVAKESAGSIKGKAKQMGNKAVEEGEEGLEWAKDKAKKGYEATKQKAGEGLESAKEAFGNKYNEAAEPHRQKARDFKDDVILGGRSRDEEL